MKDDIEYVDIEPKTRSDKHNHKVEVDDYSEKKTKKKLKFNFKHHKKENAKRGKRPYKKWEKILLICSWTFFVGCLVFYGIRFVKYYKIYNPKVEGTSAELIMTSIVKKSEIVYEGDGLYHISGMYVYKGSKVDNYIRYSNMLWRIIKFNTDGSLDLILDDSINMLKYNDSAVKFTDSDIANYLNNYFYKKLDNSDMTISAVCNDEITDLNKITCNDRDTSKNVRLLSVSEYLNSKTDASYITGGNIWLSSYKDKSVWHINGSSLSLSTPDNMFYVKPVITIKNSVILLSGSGTKDDPYIIQKSDEKQLGVGSYVKMADDELVVYDIDNDIYKLSYTKSLLSKAYGSENVYNPETKDTLAYYLNNDFLNTVDYKSMLVETDWYNGTYGSYSDVTKSSVKAKVGLLNVSDLKLTSATNYYLLTPSDNSKEYLYSETISDVKPTIKEGVVPTIAINKPTITSGSGTSSDPYVLEVK